MMATSRILISGYEHVIAKYHQFPISSNADNMQKSMYVPDNGSTNIDNIKFRTVLFTIFGEFSR